MRRIEFNIARTLRSGTFAVELGAFFADRIIYMPIEMRKITAQLLAVFFCVGTALPAVAQGPVSVVLEDEAADVEVCQDFICTKLREEILVEASKCRPLASFKRRRMRVRRAKSSNSCKLFHDENYKTSKGKCSAAIRQACERSGIDGRFLAENAFNLHKKGSA